MRTCTECEIEKDETFFRKNVSRLRSKCKTCESKRDASYNLLNKDKRQAYKKDHPTEYVKADRSRRYKQNKEKVRQQSKLYRQNNTEKIASYKKKYRTEHPELNRHYKALRRARSAKLTREESILSKAYRAAISKDACFYCGKIANVMHDDHYFPLSKGGTNHWFNLVRVLS